MNKPFLSVIVPAYNEASRLPLTLIDIDRHLSRGAYSYEIIVVNDGSNDYTADIVKRFMPLIKNLRLIDNQINRGKGAAVKQGMLEARGNIRLFTDADNSTSVDQFDKMLPHFKEGYDIVIGSRSVRGAILDPPQSIYRRILEKKVNLSIQLLLLREIKDPRCGFKAFSEEATNVIFSRARLERWGFDMEALTLAKSLGFKIKEVPVRWVNDPFSHVHIADFLQILWETVKIRWWISRRKYNDG
ncbi:hypothetical protein A3A20_02005 [Candidatus Wolfebacteria bacterium RIFCSPLOWO2_01_FULL_45_19]|uniref:dolichyl-phosphate beta-glucosyltransferase n=1 Tax=Candidatus Wolfebacteria bacterium RIFCSPLOWO2_01_FULL_45_19 TaxID=1802557 RepID=A0A1F8DV15_9BACT|nr:MAG: Glycosyl transferase, family 2 [Parcubacteria group bacterium GW2011_GWB1_45_9]OGM91688.1 MAG: hypothetical protein A3A20_02005 [Candidatus Wolfebacteria bacterium RIFCSPLOWO2_01_FULL_45_19]